MAFLCYLLAKCVAVTTVTLNAQVSTNSNLAHVNYSCESPPTPANALWLQPLHFNSV